MKKLLLSMMAMLITSAISFAQEPTFVGSETCINCHNNFDPELISEYQKSGHPYKLNPVDGAPPTYPENTSPGVIPPPGTDWDMFQYVIGGYGWKARFVKPDGRIYTLTDSAQYNLADGSWVPYHKDEDKKYNYGCFQCHTTGGTPEGSWNDVAEDSLGTFTEPGVRCEGCHGPGSDHIADPTNVTPPIVDEELTFGRCGDCHQRGGKTNAIPASKGYVRHHEQYNEMLASRHGDGKGEDLTCIKCHDPHVALRYPEAAGDGFQGISTSCENAACHPGQEILVNNVPKDISCESCHMPEATKSALGTQVGNGWQGDVATHIMGINTAAVTREAMFTEDGGLVALDGEGLAAVTLDFVCLACHTDQTVEWANTYAPDIHTNGIVTDIESSTELPTSMALHQNYPNPFNPSTAITFDLTQPVQVELNMYSVDGRLVARLVDNRMPAGFHTVRINADMLPSGSYLYELIANGERFVKTMVLSR